MQFPLNFLPPDVLATHPLSAFHPRNGHQVQGRKSPAVSAAPKAPGLHPLVYAQQLGWSGIRDDNALQARRQAAASPQVQAAYPQAQAAQVPFASAPPVPPLASTFQTYPFGGFPHGGSGPGSQVYQLPQHAANATMQQDLAVYQTQLLQAALERNLVIPYFVQTQAQTHTEAAAAPPPPPPPATATADAGPTMSVLDTKDPFVYVHPPPETLTTAQGRKLFKRLPKTRIRIEQACEACRKRKSKCTGERPTCKRCDRQEVECVYIAEHRANKWKRMQNRVPRPMDLDEGYDGDGTGALSPCPPADSSRSSSSVSVSAYSSGTAVDSRAPPQGSGCGSADTLCAPSMFYVPPPLAGSSLPRPSSVGDVQASAQLPSGSFAGGNDAMAGPSSTLRSSVSSQTIASGTSLPPPTLCVTGASSPRSQQPLSNEPNGFLHPQQCRTRIPTPHSTPLATTTDHATRAGDVADVVERLIYLAKEQDLQCRNGPPPLGRGSSSSSSNASGARSGAQTPSDYFALPLPAGSDPPTGLYSKQAARDMLAVPGQAEMARSDSVATGFSQMALSSSSLSSCGASVADSLASGTSGQDWGDDYCSLEYEMYFHSSGLPDSVPSDVSFHR
ncbi:hypothetical protein DICSQDRAFT_165844 [Dichomitus squalens LYAD-421 SS1]|uniref:uncharacterized protein n=1 Tax=Dichomitus squalens (strain LYAD-421) TaxID=732165 RepID=UPI0004412E4A|nr:uncharacterized protein DICSQDRAFT_165844 [Dichomitus squalens LYAD-421 SS1]EJF66145.1 hypothetical protein DICSQDRAFT_165844 [Dichomitus squalens LYAD-421 SS1]